MKTCRKPIVMVLLLLIHLLTLRNGVAVAGREDTNVSNVEKNPGDIILEEVIVTGSGNDTRITANALVEDPSRIADGILSLLSKREIRRRRSQETSSNLDESRTVIVNVHDDDDLEKLKNAITEYEPQRITSGKAKRKIIDVPSNTHGSTTQDLEKTYHDVLRNISRAAPKLATSSANVSLNPYLSQATKNFKHIYTPEVTIRAATAQTYSDVDASYAASSKKRKAKELFDKYLQSNRTVAPSRVSSNGESKHDEETVSSTVSTTPKEYFTIPNGSSSESNIYFDSTGKPENREWNVRELSSQIVPPFTISRSTDAHAYNVFNMDNVNKKLLSNFPSGSKTLRLSPSRHDTAPRPFVASQLSHVAAANTNIETSRGQPRSSSSDVDGKRQQVPRSSGNALPLVLPTDLFIAPAITRHYVPIKRFNPNRFNLHGNSATPSLIVASTPTNLATRSTVFAKPNANYAVPYANVIGAPTRTPTYVADSHRGSNLLDYHAVTKTSTAMARTPGPTSASYILQRREENPQTVPEQEFLPRIVTYDRLDHDGKSDISANPGLALYNKFVSSHSAHARPIARDYQDVRKTPMSASQQVSALPSAILEPLSSKPSFPVSLKIRPTTMRPLAPYYNSKLFVSVDGKEHSSGKNDRESVETYQQPLKDAIEVEEEVADNKSSLGSYKTLINHEIRKDHEIPKERQEKESRERDLYQQRSPDHGHLDRYHEDNDEKDDRDGKYEGVRSNDNEDEKGTDETREEDERVSTGKDEDQHNRNYHHRYDKYGSNRENSEEEEEREKQQYSRKKYEDKDNRDKHNHDTDVKQKFANNYKYPYSSHNDYGTRAEDKEYHDRKKSEHGNRYKKDRRDREHEEHEAESVAEDKSVGSKDQRVHRQRGKKRNNGNDTVHGYKYQRTDPQENSRYEKSEYEEYDETSPKHVRQEYYRQQQRDEDDHRDRRRHDSESEDDDDDDDDEELRDHVHGETQEHVHKHEEHHDKGKDDGDHKFEEGEGAKHEEEHHGHKGEKGDKGYKVWHEHEKEEKGYHDKEHTSKEYDEKEGKEKKHEEEGGYHEEHHHGEAGEKAAEFGEKGKHQKGHSTKGEHSVHKKDEYEKKTEFFDEFHEDGDIEKHGGHHHKHESKKGGHEKKGHHDIADHEEKHGKEGKYEKGGHHHEDKGHKVAEGHDHHHDHDQKYGKKEGHDHGKKWSYEKGDDGGKASNGHKHDR